jgi:alpha-glucosidase
VPFEDDLQSGGGGLAGDDWWRSAVIYQICPRSFADSGGDGVGDLPGITGRLDYLVDLGVDAVWLSPFYASPMVDFGYDITDHCVVDPVFGTLADFDGLLAAAHACGLRVLVDFVPNHTSNQHPWFAESRSSRVSRRRDWYVWANPAPGGGPPNNWLSAFPAAGSAWTLDEPTGQYYLHSYTTAQPDLNWHNAEVRAAMADVLRFFLDRGVDGFRIDAAHRLIKDPTLAGNPADVAGARTALAPGGWRLRHIDQPGVHTVLRELRAVLAGYGGDRLLLGEVGVADPARWAAYYGRDDELTLPLNFGFWSQPFTAAGFRTAVGTTEGVLPPGAWPIYALGNHDLPRLASRYDDGRHGQARARLAAMLLLTLRGTPLLYYGDEIGMTDVSIPPEATVDSNGRDPARTPMQWDATGGAGFTTGRPWLPIPASAPTVNVAAERDEPGSLLNLYRDLIGLRREHPVLRDGDYQVLAPTQPALYAYLRRTGGQRILVTLNFGDHPHDLDHPEVGTGQILLSTHDHPQPGSLHPLRLAPYEGVIASLT